MRSIRLASRRQRLPQSCHAQREDRPKPAGLNARAGAGVPVGPLDAFCDGAQACEPRLCGRQRAEGWPPPSDRCLSGAPWGRTLGTQWGVRVRRRPVPELQLGVGPAHWQTRGDRVTGAGPQTGGDRAARVLRAGQALPRNRGLCRRASRARSSWSRGPLSQHAWGPGPEGQRGHSQVRGQWHGEDGVGTPRSGTRGHGLRGSPGCSPATSDLRPPELGRVCVCRLSGLAWAPLSRWPRGAVAPAVLGVCTRGCGAPAPSNPTSVLSPFCFLEHSKYFSRQGFVLAVS